VRDLVVKSVKIVDGKAGGTVMAISLKSLGIEQLDIDDRLALIEELWDSIAEDSADVPLTDAQREELNRRIAGHEANPDDVVSWEDVKKSISERIKK
jgi:putative addiction module component (TIGR02574 family)